MNPIKKLIILIPIVIFSCKQQENKTGSLQDRYFIEVDSVLDNAILSKWYPLCLDSLHGGFLPTINHQWEIIPPYNKMIVAQTRHAWTPAYVGLHYQDSELLKKVARHGFENLRSTMWDNEFGGFHDLVSRTGEVILEENNGLKTAYGNSFGIYAAATYYEYSQNEAALELAMQAFQWLEKNSHDSIHGGYFQHLNREGRPLHLLMKDGKEMENGAVGLKDYNSSIHLLEAFSQLYKVHKNEMVKERLQEMFYIVRDTMVDRNGYLRLYFQPDWTWVTYRDSLPEYRRSHYHRDHVTFGHDVETAFLLMEAAHELGLGDDSTTLMLGKKMVDHALEKGWDEDNGGFYYEGIYQNREMEIVTPGKSWWVTAEGLNALLMMHQYFPEEEKYWKAFEKLWQYTKTYQLDPENGGWYPWGTDITPEAITMLKGQYWKASYHSARSMVNCLKMLKGEKLLGGEH